VERLNLGCGPNPPSGWVNLDGSWNAWFFNHPHLRRVLVTVGLISGHETQWHVRPVVHDLKKPLPFKGNTFSCIYASHVLEHLYLVEGQSLLSECKRVLKPGGVLRLVVPDLHSMVVEYMQRRSDGTTAVCGDKSAADHLNERLGFRSAVPPKGKFLTKFYATWKDFHSHKWMYDSDSLVRYLKLAGFQQVSEKKFLSSEIPGIEEVEREERVLNGAGICIEGKKTERDRGLAAHENRGFVDQSDRISERLPARA
jgi:predicted SAM-dependent methyltransferase